jgi:hypothetical protein
MDTNQVVEVEPAKVAREPLGAESRILVDYATAYHRYTVGSGTVEQLRTAIQPVLGPLLAVFRMVEDGVLCQHYRRVGTYCADCPDIVARSAK